MACNYSLNLSCFAKTERSGVVVAQDATFIFPLERPSMGNYLRNKEFDESGGSPPSPTGDGGYLLYLWNGSW